MSQFCIDGQIVDLYSDARKLRSNLNFNAGRAAGRQK